MTVTHIGQFQRYLGTSSDSKPSGAAPGSEFYETDTQKTFRSDGSTWAAIPATGIVAAGTPALYRTGVAAADVLAVPGALTTSPQAGGSCTAGTYKVKVVAGNAYGRTTATAGSDVVTATTNLTVRVLFAAVTGATFYDIYVSTDTDPKFVGRITEAQRASGILLTAVNTTGAGGTAGGVDVQVPGTGLQAGTTAAQNTAYSIPASPVNCAGRQYIDFDLVSSRTGDSAALSLIVVPFWYNATLGAYAAGAPQTLTFGGTAGNYQPNIQRLRFEARGNDAMALAVASIAGTGAAITMYATVS